MTWIRLRPRFQRGPSGGSEVFWVNESDPKQEFPGLPGLDLVPVVAADLATKATQGDFQAALALARLAAESSSPGLRQSLSGLIRQISHPEALQVTLLYLLSELAKRPEQGLEVVLRELESPHWVATPAGDLAGGISGPPEGGQLPIELDPHSLRSLLVASDAPARASIVKRLLASGELDQACELPLSGDEWQELWPALESDPERLARHLLRLPVLLLCEGLSILSRSGHLSQRLQPLVEQLPEDLDLLGWATPAPSRTVSVQTVPFERYSSDAPYCDGSDGRLETEQWKIEVNERAVSVTAQDGSRVHQITFPAAQGAPEYQDMAEHDRFFEDLTRARSVVNKASSVALSPDGLQLAVATLDGGLRIFDLTQGELESEVYPPATLSEEALPVRLRFSADGQVLSGVRLGHYFVYHQGKERTLDSLRPDLRGLFFRGEALWSIFRDGSVLRLDPTQGKIYQELPARGVLPALSPDRRFLVSYAADQVQWFLLGDRGLLLLSQLPAPFPVRIHFSQQGQALVLRFADPQKPGLRTALLETCWRKGHQCLSEMTQVEHTQYQDQARRQPHPVWDFLLALVSARQALV